MNRRSLIAALGALGLGGLPSFAFAQYDGSDDSAQFLAALDQLGLSGDQRWAVRTVLSYGASPSDPNVRLAILAVLDDDQRTRLFQTMKWAPTDWTANRWENPGDVYASGGGPVTGTVASASGYEVRLAQGPRVQMHRGTFISPTGATVAAGQHIVATGTAGNDGIFRADRVDIVFANGSYSPPAGDPVAVPPSERAQDTSPAS